MADENEAIWKCKYNYVSLLNLAEDVRRFGGYHQLWEGSFMGEGSLQLLKRHINQGLKGIWAFNTPVQKYWEDKGFHHGVVEDCAANLLSGGNKYIEDLPVPVQQMLQTIKDIGIEHSDCADHASLEEEDESVEMVDADNEGLDEENGLFSERRYKDYHVYRSEAQALENLTNSVPVCGIILQQVAGELLTCDCAPVSIKNYIIWPADSKHLKRSSAR
jgi:hypothetical protein